MTTAWKAVATWTLAVQRGLGSLAAGLNQAAKRARWRIFHHEWHFRSDCKHAEAFMGWLRLARATDLTVRTRVARLRATALAVAKRAADHDQKVSQRNWQSWLREGPAKGLGRQHKVSRVAGGWVPSAIGVVMEGPDQAVDPGEGSRGGSEGDELEENDAGCVAGSVVVAPSPRSRRSMQRRRSGARSGSLGAWCRMSSGPRTAKRPNVWRSCRATCFRRLSARSLMRQGLDGARCIRRSC